MFLINMDKNEAESINKKTFQELKFKERSHLQEWIYKNTDILGERLLIIQKEFSGFDDTNERLDLLALDETGNLVIIENKLDDSGKDVVWQALKYASYCSSLTKQDIREIFQSHLDKFRETRVAEDELCDFFESDEYSELELNNDEQRIILVAAKFRKEVTSTAMWLLDHNVRIKCVKVTPYELNDQILLDTEQIIPVVDAEEYQIKIAQKKQKELIDKEVKQTRHTIRFKFWTQFIQVINQKSNLYQNISPSKDNWISSGSGYSGITYACVITKTHSRVELYISRGEKEINKQIFDQLYEYKSDVDDTFEGNLEWQRLDNKKASRIAYRLDNVNAFQEEDWPKMIQFLTTNIIKMESTFKSILTEVIR